MQVFTVIFYQHGVQTGSASVNSKSAAGAIRRVMREAKQTPEFDQVYAKPYAQHNPQHVTISKGILG